MYWQCIKSKEYGILFGQTKYHTKHSSVEPYCYKYTRLLCTVIYNAIIHKNVKSKNKLHIIFVPYKNKGNLSVMKRIVCANFGYYTWESFLSDSLETM